MDTHIEVFNFFIVIDFIRAFGVTVFSDEQRRVVTFFTQPIDDASKSFTCLKHKKQFVFLVFRKYCYTKSITDFRSAGSAVCGITIWKSESLVTKDNAFTFAEK